MKIKFCGAAQTVTGSCHLLTLEDGYTILMDAGFYQGRKKEFNVFNRTWLFNPADIDCMLLSHAHIDHCGNPFGFADLKYIRKAEDSKKLNTSKEPAIIISASGMITAGRIRHHVFHNIENKNTTVLIVGYCAPGTLGAILRNGAKRARIFRKDLRVRARIEILDSFSAHADQMEMIEFLSNLNRERLKTLFLVHGEKDQQEIFKSALEKHGFSNIKFPKLKEEFTLNAGA
ncbi:MBL fold metallo-hydrolase RNA specificity domain-containing protein [Candidatus Omnitrophota bacterium]